MRIGFKHIEARCTPSLPHNVLGLKWKRQIPYNDVIGNIGGQSLGSAESLILYIGAKSPGVDKRSNWLPTPNGNFSLYIRAYWGKEGIIHESWKPPVIRKVS